MSSAIERIVTAYVKLGNRQALEDLIAHRERLALDVRGRRDFNFSVALDALDSEIAMAKAGLDLMAGGSRHEDALRP